MSSLGQIGKNGVSEIFEDLTYQTAYSTIISDLKNISGIDNEIVNEAVTSGLTVMASGALFLFIQKQEEYIERIMTLVYTAITALVTPFGNLLKNRLRKLKGVKLFRRFGLFNSLQSDRINTARMAVEIGKSHIHGNEAQNTFYQRAQTSTIMRDNVIRTENHNLQYAKAKSDGFNQTLLFKLLTQNFTAIDKEFLKRILGRDIAGDLDVEDINKVANFMYITDDTGNIRGLSEQFMTMINGLGYMHNKGA